MPSKQMMVRYGEHAVESTAQATVSPALRQDRLTPLSAESRRQRPRLQLERQAGVL